MKRRGFLGFLGLGGGASIVPFGSPSSPTDTTSKSHTFTLLQTSPVAGFQYYDGEKVWQNLAIGDAVQLVRQPDNKHDEYAIEVYWKDRKLGYVPRVANRTLAQMLDRGETLTAKIANRQSADNPWERLEIEIGLIT
ncbi:HIRAN domain-containing protein [Thermoleptolyngbya sp.]